MTVLSIQSTVAYGHVGNAAAVPACHALGREIWPLATVALSNHPGHGSARGRAVAAARLREIVRGLDELGVLVRCEAVLTGYLGSAANARAAAAAVALVRRRNPMARYCCDPVMGNEAKGLFVAPAVADAVATLLVPRADIVVPNRFELGRLAGRTIGNLDDARAACRTILATGPALVVATGLRRGDRIGVLAAADGDAWLAETPYVGGVAEDGAGDLFTALFLARLLDSHDIPAALRHATAATYDVVRRTKALGADELAIVPARAAIATPPDAATLDKLE